MDEVIVSLGDKVDEMLGALTQMQDRLCGEFGEGDRKELTEIDAQLAAPLAEVLVAYNIFARRGWI